LRFGGGELETRRVSLRVQQLACVSELSVNEFELSELNIQTLHTALREVREEPGGAGNGVEDRVTSGGAQAFICVSRQICRFPPPRSCPPGQGSVSAEKLQFRNIRAGRLPEPPKRC
jgi:hypothetical protein